MTLTSCLTFITNVLGYLASSDLFTIVLIGTFSMFALLMLIKVVWTLVSIN